MVGAVSSRTPNYGFAIIRYDSIGWHSYEHDNWRSIDALLQSVGNIPSVRGVWANGVAYAVGDRVIDTADSTTWRCVTAHTSASTGTFDADRTANPTYWTRFSTVPSFVNDWVTGVTYNVNDIVRNGNAWYYCVEAHTSGTFLTDFGDGKWETIVDYQDAIDAETAAVAAATSATTSAAAAAASATTAETAETNAVNSALLADNSATGAVIAQTAAAGSASAAATSASNAATSASNAATSAADAATLYDNFDDRYLGPKASPPTVDNDGNALVVGALYYRTTATQGMYVWDGAAWAPIGAGGGMFKGNNGTVGSRSGDILRINALTLTSDTTVSATENASATGPLAVDTGVTLIVASGGTLVIL